MKTHFAAGLSAAILAALTVGVTDAFAQTPYSGIVAGAVNGSGTPQGGSKNYTVSKTSTGRYLLTFPGSSFTNIPVCLTWPAATAIFESSSGGQFKVDVSFGRDATFNFICTALSK